MEKLPFCIVLSQVYVDGPMIFWKQTLKWPVPTSVKSTSQWELHRLGISLMVGTSNKWFQKMPNSTGYSAAPVAAVARPVERVVAVCDPRRISGWEPSGHRLLPQGGAPVVNGLESQWLYMRYITYKPYLLDLKKTLANYGAPPCMKIHDFGFPLQTLWFSGGPQRFFHRGGVWGAATIGRNPGRVGNYWKLWNMVVMVN